MPILMFVILGFISVSCSKNLESERFNVYFYFDGSDSSSEKYLGEVEGLSNCQREARGFASTKGNSDNWDYICCLKDDDSSCKEKHK
jgi:hypothetical protein